MNRRDFFTLLGSAAMAWPPAARAQQGDRMRRVGALMAGVRGGVPYQMRLDAFKLALATLGWVDGRNLRVDERWNADTSDRLRAAAADLLGLAPDAIFVQGSGALSVVKDASRTIPIVFSNVVDPVGQGFVASLARPGGNITGFAQPDFAVATKVLDLFKKIAPGITRITLLYDPLNPSWVGYLAELDAAAASFDVLISSASVHDADEIERAFEALARQPNAGLIVHTGAATNAHRGLIIALAARHRLPAFYQHSYFVSDGGLASIGIDDIDVARRVAGYVDRIFKGEKPADLPVQQSTDLRFVLNLRTAKALGLDLPLNVLALADEVIE